MTTSLLLGLAIGWIGSMPVAGAVSFFIFQRGLCGRSGHGLALAGGAALAESCWCLALLLGAGELLDYWPAAASVARSLGGLLLIGLGIFFLARRPAVRRQTTAAAAATQPRLRDEFRLGATLVAVNPAIPFNWLAVITIAISLGLDPSRAPAAFALGVGLGIIAWFALLLRVICAWRERVHVNILARVQQGFAALLICAGCFALWQEWL